jgi:hypothetical protein
MASINVLIVVDVVAAVQQGLATNVWMLDTGRYLNTQEAGNELVTTLNSGDQVIWSLAAIDPGTNVQFAAPPAFTSNSGTIPAIIDPKQNPIDPSQYLGKFSPPGGTQAGTTYQYSVVLSMNGQNYTFDPFLKLYTTT